MAAIPSIADFTDASVTEGEFKSALTGLHNYLTGLLGTAGTQDAAQSAIGALLGAGVSSRSANYTIAESDRGRLITCTGTFTLSLPAAATIGAGFAFAVANLGTGSITIDPSGSETISGQPTGSVSPNACLIVACTGSTWVIAGASSGRGMQVFTSSGTFVAPAGVTSVKVSVVGGGGNGGSATSASLFNHAAGGGGGGGGVAIGVVSGSALTQSIAVTVGSAGQASSFGQIMQAGGGGHGGSAAQGSSGSGGVGGSGSGGTFNLTGSSGRVGDRVNAELGGMGGASSIQAPIMKNKTGYSSDGATAYYSEEIKAIGFMGLGFGGGGSSGAGKAASGYGNGGGGGYSSNDGTITGGTGSPGIVIVEW